MKLTEELIRDAVLRLAKEDTARITWSESGVNSRSARIQTASGRELFVKGYLVPEGDGRPRVDNEFNSLRFLWENGIRDIPQPLVTEPQNEISIFSSVNGRRFRPEFISAADVETAVRFFASLQGLRSQALARNTAPASEAYFSLNGHFNRIEVRLAELEALPLPELTERVGTVLRPAWTALREDFADGARQLDLDPDAELPQERRILSPSDVGFHNVLKEEGTGRLVFIDFEYFGWDDPVKLASDFVLAPSVQLPQQFRIVFLKRIAEALEWTPADRERFLLYYPLLSFKWCLIALNVFLPNRRPFLTGDIDNLFKRRLRVSAKLFDRLLAELKSKEYERWVM